jgi:hypothetical protein
MIDTEMASRQLAVLTTRIRKQNIWNETPNNYWTISNFCHQSLASLFSIFRKEAEVVEKVGGDESTKYGRERERLLAHTPISEHYVNFQPATETNPSSFASMPTMCGLSH